MTAQHDRFGPLVGADLYTIDSKGKTRFWRLERNEPEGDSYRSVSGIVGTPAASASGWTQCKPKNVGRSNATTAAEQCVAEIQAEYRKKQERKYHASMADVGAHKYFQPMLAEKYADEFRRVVAAPVVFSQPKLDGIRCIASASGLWSRNGKPFDIPHIWTALEPLFARHPRLILDGEFYNHELRDDFNQISSLIKKPTEETARLVQYHVYDVPSTPGGFFGRADALIRLALSLPLVPVPTVPTSDMGSLDMLFAEYLEAGYEGQMVRLDLPYENKRSKSLLKRKEFLDGEFPLVRVEEGNGNWAGLAKRAIFSLPDGRTFGSGIRGSKDDMAKLLGEWNKYQCATVRYFALTPDGIPRFPVAVAWHEFLTERL